MGPRQRARARGKEPRGVQRVGGVLGPAPAGGEDRELRGGLPRAPRRRPRRVRAAAGGQGRDRGPALRRRVHARDDAGNPDRRERRDRRGVPQQRPVERGLGLPGGHRRPDVVGVGRARLPSASLPVMDFDLTDEQKLIRETARSFTDNEIVDRARENDRNEHFDLELVAQLAEQGYLGAIVPRDYGGAGLDYLTYG